MGHIRLSFIFFFSFLDSLFAVANVCHSVVRIFSFLLLPLPMLFGALIEDSDRYVLPFPPPPNKRFRCQTKNETKRIGKKIF